MLPREWEYFALAGSIAAGSHANGFMRMTELIDETLPPADSTPVAATPLWRPLEHVRLGGLWVATASRAELLAAALYDTATRQPGQRARLIFDANGHGVSMAARDTCFRQMIDEADVVHADGGFLVTASRWLTGKKVAERSATTDMIHDFAKGAGDKMSFFLLGGSEKVNADTVRIMQKTYPSLRIAGRRNGYFSREEEEGVIAEINAARPDILWVGLGKPLEQEFCLRVRDRLDVTWIITCGGCYNYITGDYPRAPKWMQQANLEWIHRATTKPKQLFWRYLTTTPHALLVVACGSTRETQIRCN